LPIAKHISKALTGALPKPSALNAHRLMLFQLGLAVDFMILSAEQNLFLFSDEERSR
jgi:hypothetical protein